MMTIKGLPLVSRVVPCDTMAWLLDGPCVCVSLGTWTAWVGPCVKREFTISWSAAVSSRGRKLSKGITFPYPPTTLNSCQEVLVVSEGWSKPGSQTIGHYKILSIEWVPESRMKTANQLSHTQCLVFEHFRTSLQFGLCRANALLWSSGFLWTSLSRHDKAFLKVVAPSHCTERHRISTFQIQPVVSGREVAGTEHGCLYQPLYVPARRSETRGDLKNS